MHLHRVRRHQQGALFDLLGIPTGTDVTADALPKSPADRPTYDDQDEPQPSNVAAIANRLEWMPST